MRSHLRSSSSARLRSCLSLFSALLSLLLVVGCGGNGGNSGGGGGGASADARVASLVLTNGTLTPAFSADVLVYTASVPSTVTEVRAVVIAADTGARITVNGQLVASGATSAAQPLVEGGNPLGIGMTAADGVTSRTYTVTVTRAPVPALSALSLSMGSVSPAFNASTTSYTATTAFLAAQTKVTATTTVPGASITVNGAAVTSGQPSAAIALGAGLTNITVRVTTPGAETRDYVVAVTRQPIAQFAQEAYAKASNTGADDAFGSSVALSGNTLAVGVPLEDSNVTGINTGNQGDNSAPSSGAVYVFTRSGTTWTQQAYIKASNAESSDQFGISVALSGDTLAVGANFEDSNATGINGNQADNSVAASGAVYVFTRNGTTWTQQAYVKPSNTAADDLFGISVALSGDTLAVGASFEDSSATGINGNQADNGASSAGAVYVFTRSGTTWTQQAYVKASNTAAADQFGDNIALSGDTLAVGAVFEDSNATGINGDQASNTAADAGAAYVFTRNGTTWTQQAYVKASNAEAGDRFGGSVALSGDTLAIGTRFEGSNATGIDGNQADNSASSSGAVYVFTRSGTAWTQQAYIKASNTGASDQFGDSVALSGDTLAVGAISEDGNATGINGNQANEGSSASGAVYVFTRSGTTWTQQAYVKASNTGAGDACGESVAVGDDTVVMGASGEDSGATGINGDQLDNAASAGGAIYVIR